MNDDVPTVVERFQDVVSSRISPQRAEQRGERRRWTQGLGEVLFAVCPSSK